MCGIFAVINQEEDIFDYQTFSTLGVLNDSRGGDSCGIFIDGNVEYGIGNKAYFESFFWSSELLNNTATAKIALGHCRKASPGMPINLQNAHPIVITEDVTVTEGESPRKEIKFVLVHNGTLYNYEKLAKKYIPDVDIKDMTDSQVIARLIYYSGFDWLAEYNGGTAFIAVDYRQKDPQIYIWRGESKKSSVDKDSEEERPLYCNTDNNRLVVSSIASGVAICDGNAFYVPANTVLIYKNKKLYKFKEIDRSKAQQNKIYDPTTYVSSGNTYSASISEWLRHNEKDNIYRIGKNKADGNIRLTTYGKILTKYDSYTQWETPHTVYFFNGIPLIEKKAYQFLYKAWKRTHLDLESFTENYQNLIRYFSTDQLYFFDQKAFRAITPWRSTLFDGYYFPLAQARKYKFVQGVLLDDYVIATAIESYSCLDKVPNIDYRTIWKEFIQSIV